MRPNRPKLRLQTTVPDPTYAAQKPCIHVNTYTFPFLNRDTTVHISESKSAVLFGLTFFYYGKKIQRHSNWSGDPNLEKQ